MASNEEDEDEDEEGCRAEEKEAEAERRVSNKKRLAKLMERALLQVIFCYHVVHLLKRPLSYSGRSSLFQMPLIPT